MPNHSARRSSGAINVNGTVLFLWKAGAFDDEIYDLSIPVVAGEEFRLSYGELELRSIATETLVVYMDGYATSDYKGFSGKSDTGMF